MKKILITGSRNYGLCEAICNLFDTINQGYVDTEIEYETASRSNGYQLDTNEGQKKLAEHYIDGNFNIFINNSAIWKFQQVMIVESVFTIATKLFVLISKSHLKMIHHYLVMHKNVPLTLLQLV